MRRVPSGLFVVLIALAVVGCTGTPVTLPPATPAPPQKARLDWVEPTSPKAPRLVFTVRQIDVLSDGWRAEVGIRNDTSVPWTFAAAGAPEASFGLMLFATGDLTELERRIGDQSLPGLRAAHAVVPTPPARLAPGATWEGSILAPGALASGRWVRVVFGPLIAGDEPPEGLPTPLLWISDNAHLLKG